METTHADVFLRLTTALDASTAWERLLGRSGLCARGSLLDAQEGGPFAIETGAGDVFRGQVLEIEPARKLSLRIDNMNGSELHLELAETDPDRIRVTFALVAIGLHHDEIFSFDANWQVQLRDLFSAPGKPS